MAAGLGEVARLITVFKLCAGFGVKGLSRTCKSGARSIGCNFSSVLKPIMYLVLNESIGAPFCIEVQITVDRHGEVKCLFRAVFVIEPADKGVIAVFGVFRSIWHC